MISVQAAIYQFKAIIGTSASWISLVKSQFVEHLAIFQSWALRDAQWKVERAVQEFFLATALNDSSIKAQAEGREYVPRKATPSRGLISITNNGAAAVPLPDNTAFISDAQVDYLIESAVTIPPGGTVSVEGAQLFYAPPLIDTVLVPGPFYEVMFPASVIGKLNRFIVSVDEGAGFVEWSYARLFQNSLADAQVYDEFYSHDGRSGVRFGNGIFGKIPALNAVIRINYWTTDGATTLILGQKLQLVSDVNDMGGNLADLTVAVIPDAGEDTGGIDGGGAAEGISEMRKNLHYWPRYNGKLVWDEDYAFFVRSKIANITWFKAWGEEAQELESGPDVSNINRIFLTGYAPGNDGLGDDVLAELQAVPLLNRKFQWVEPVLSSFTISVSGSVARSADIPTAVNGIKAVLAANYGPDSASRLDPVNMSDLYRLIDATGYFKGVGANYQIALDGVMNATQLKEMVSLDIEASSFTLTYPS